MLNRSEKRPEQLYSRVAITEFFNLLDDVKSRKLIIYWVLSLVVSIGLGIASIEYGWSGLEVKILGKTNHITVYPTLIICTLWTLWFGFWWGFIPAYMATFFLAGYSGMSIGWSAIFALADPLGLALISMAYLAIPRAINLTTSRAIFYYVFITFASGIIGSAGSFIWTYTSGAEASDAYSIWQGWWIGAFLQGVLINGPLLYYFTGKVNNWKSKHLEVIGWKVPATGRIIQFFAGMAVAVSIFIIAGSYLSSKAIESELSAIADASVIAIAHDAIRSTALTTWIILALSLSAAYFGYEIAVSYISALRDAADQQAKLLSKLEKSNLELKNVNQQLQASKDDLVVLNSSKDRFLSIIAHDLKSPFSSLLGLSEYLEQDYENFEEDKKRQFIQAIHRSARHMFNLLQNLLQWANLQQGRIAMHAEKLDIGSMIRQNIELHRPSAEKKSIEIAVHAEKDAPVLGDRQMIDATLRNLISNAIKFTDEQGRIEISTHSVNGMVLVQVRDTGVGMTDSVKRSLFNIETKTSTMGTANEKGSGLGLILCKDFVERNAGSIEIESEEGVGTTVSILLPEFDSSVQNQKMEQSATGES